MSVYTKILSLIEGVPRTIDFSVSGNTLGVSALQIDGSAAGSITLHTAATTTPYSIYFPSTQGGALSFLQNDGSGNLAWSTVNSCPAISNVFTAGENFAANTSFIVRWGMNALSESTDEIYKADYSTVSYDEFWGIGIALSPVTVLAGQNITVYSFGGYTLGSSDTPFSTGQIGNPVWLTSGGAFSTTAPTGGSEADMKIGIVMSTTQIWVDGQMMGVGGASSGGGPVPLGVIDGGTGLSTLTPYALMAGGTTSTGEMQQISGLGTAGYVLTSNGASALPTWQVAGAGSGTVTSVSVVSANGFAGTVATATTTPAITLTTSITGLLKGNGTAISAASAGTDYVIPSGSITGTAANITATTNSTLTTLSSLSLPYSQLSGTVPTWNQNTTGTAANITATSNSTLTTLSSLSLPGSQVSGNISGNAANVTGTVAIANGGTGQTTQQAAINALTGTQSAGEYLRSDGTNATLSAIQAGDVPTLNQNTTGTAANITATSNATLTTLSALTTASSLSSIGTITSGIWQGGTIGVAHSGTGATTAQGAFDNLSPLTTAGDMLYYNGTHNVRLAIGSTGQVLEVVGGEPAWATAPATGVTSVALSDGSSTPIYSISGSPVTSSGTLTFSLETQSANKVFAGPTTGSAAQPTFRSLVSADIPSLSSIYLPLAGGTMSGAINMGSNQINALATPTLSTDAATKGYVDAAINGLTWKGPAQAYAASNVALTGGATLTVDGYSVQNGDLVILGNQTTASQNGEYVASGIGSSYTLTSNGLPNAIGDAWLITNGTIYKDSSFVANAAVPSATFTEFAGPTAYTFNSPLSLTGSTVSISQANTSTNGYLSSTDWNTFNGKQASGNYITALTGDVTASGPGSASASLTATTNSTLTTLSGLTTASSLTTVGSITSGAWAGTAIAIAHGGTGQNNASSAFNALNPMTTTGDTIYESATGVASRLAIGSTGNVLTVSGGVPVWAAPATSGTVTSVALSVPATSIFGVTGSPVTSSGTLGLTTTGTSGGIPYFSSTSALSSSALLTASQLIIGGGAGTAPSTLAAGSQYQVLVMGATTPGYGQVNLAQNAAITGILPVGNGGTGSNTLTAHAVLVGEGGSIAEVGPGTVSYPLVSNGLSSDPSFQILPVAGGGTGSATVVTIPAASAWAGWDANKNLSANNHIEGYTTTVTAAGTTTLVVGSTYEQYFTGTSTQTVVLPVTSTLVLGQQFLIQNRSTGTVTVQSSGANTIKAMEANTQLLVTVISTSLTTAAAWDYAYSVVQGALPVDDGGTGLSSTTAYAVLTGGTTSTGALQQVSGVGTSGQVLTSNGASALPTWQAAGGSSLIYYAGKVTIGSAATSISITYSTAFANTSYALTGTMFNTTDTNPEFQPIVITAQSTTGATFTWNFPTATANYAIMWHAITNN